MFIVTTFINFVLSTAQKIKFSITVSSVNVTKSAGNCGFSHICWRNPYWKTSFFVPCPHISSSSYSPILFPSSPPLSSSSFLLSRWYSSLSNGILYRSNCRMFSSLFSFPPTLVAIPHFLSKQITSYLFFISLYHAVTVRLVFKILRSDAVSFPSTWSFKFSSRCFSDYYSLMRFLKDLFLTTSGVDCVLVINWWRL